MKKRRWLTLGIVLVLIVAAVVIVASNQRSVEQAAALANVQIGRVIRASLSLVVESSGSVTPESSLTLSFDTSGSVATVNVQPGDRVQRGDVLAELDANDLERQVAMQEQAYLIQQASYSMTVQPDPDEIAAAQAALSNAAAAYELAAQRHEATSAQEVSQSCGDNLDNAKRTYDDALNAYNNLFNDHRVVVRGSYEVSPEKARLDRARASYEQALASCNLARIDAGDNSSVLSALVQYEGARVTLDKLMNPSALTLATAQAQLDNAWQSLEQAQRQLGKARLIAPSDGVILQVSATVGGPSSGAAIVLADVSRYHVDVLVDETEIAQVQTGQAAEITFDALPDASVAGSVSRIDPVGTVNQGVVYYAARVDLDPTEVAMRIDMTTNVRIILDTHADVLTVPGGALRLDGDDYYVNVVGADNQPQRVDVTTGYTDGDLTEVSGDLQFGQQVYVGEPPQAQQQQSGFNLFGLRLGGR
jgi:RND family efflux transporter MFP subunit